jgi:hypothetical protein
MSETIRVPHPYGFQGYGFDSSIGRKRNGDRRKVFRMPFPRTPKLYFPRTLMRDSLSVAQAILLATSARHRLFARAFQEPV